MESGSTAVIENVYFENNDIRSGNAITDDGKPAVEITDVDRGVIHINELTNN